jgi:hypothetical protein
MKKIAFIIIAAVAVIIVAIFIFTQTGTEQVEQDYKKLLEQMSKSQPNILTTTEEEIREYEDRLRSAGLAQDEIEKRILDKQEEIIIREREKQALETQTNLIQQEDIKKEEFQEDQTTKEIREKYLAILKREPTLSELNNHKRDISRQMYTIGFLDTLLNNSNELEIQNNIKNIYRTYLKREPTEAELNMRLNAISMGFTFQNIIDEIVLYSPEYQNEIRKNRDFAYSDFTLSQTGPLPNSRCINIHDVNEPHLWTNTFLCANNPNYDPQLRYFSNINLADIEAFRKVSAPIRMTVMDQIHTIDRTNDCYNRDPSRIDLYECPDEMVQIYNDNPNLDVSWKNNFLIYPVNDKYRFSFKNNISQLNSTCVGNNTARCIPFGPPPSLDRKGLWKQKYLCYELKSGTYPDEYKNPPPNDVCNIIRGK